MSQDNNKGWIAHVGTITIDDLIQDLGFNAKQGAITTFTGILREESDYSDKKVHQMVVESWIEKGNISMNMIATEIGNKFNLLAVRIVHLEGFINIGDPIVFVVLSSIHRKEAFTALEEIIDSYKQKSPVWKKEIYEDGTDKWITTAKIEK